MVELLVLALSVRVVYAYGLPLNGDEFAHLQIAQTISLHPDTFHVPLGNSVTNHGNGILYLIAVAEWVSHGSLLGIRLFFIAIGIGGLLGIYFLARSYFGHWAGIAALFLASIDRCLIAYSCQFHELGVSLSLVPWTLLLMQYCLDEGKPRHWLLMGLLCGIGWNVYQLFVFLPLVFVVYLLVSGKILLFARQPWAYASLGLFLALLAPNALWNVFHQYPILQYGGAKSGTLGVCPRFVVLYLDGLLLCLKDPVWIATYVGEKVHTPVQVPCHWISGAIYLACLVYSTFYVRTGRFGLLLTAVLVPAVVSTVVAVDEPYDNFRWASCTLIPVLCLTGWVVGLATNKRVGRTAVVMGVVCFTVLTAQFLSGPKWGYFCPDWERAYIGQVRAKLCERFGPEAESTRSRRYAEIRELTAQALARDDGCVMAWFYRGAFAETDAERAESYDRVLQLDRNNGLVILSQADELLEAGDANGAKQQLEVLISRDPELCHARRRLAEVEYRLGHYDAAIAHSCSVLATKPEDYDLYRLLYNCYNNLGKEAEAEAALKAFAAKHCSGPASAYVSVAMEAMQRGQLDECQRCMEWAIESEPRRPEVCAHIGGLLLMLNQVDRAVQYFEKAARLGSTEPMVYFFLGTTMEAEGRFASAVEYYEKVVELDPEHGKARLRLGILSARGNVFDDGR